MQPWSNWKLVLNDVFAVGGMNLKCMVKKIWESKWHLQFHFNYTFQFQFQTLQFWFWAIPELELKAILIPTLELVPTQGDRASADMVFDVMLFQICYITAFLA